MTQQSQQPMKIVDINGVFVEAFLLDSNNEIAFISLIGKDTALQEFRARWSLPASQGGLTDFQVETDDSTLRLFLGEIKKMQTLSGRLSTHLFGDLIQLWLFKELSQTPNYANRQAIQLYRPDDDADAIQDNLWTLIKDLSHLPLLDEWRVVIVDLLVEKQWITTWQGIGYWLINFTYLKRNWRYCYKPISNQVLCWLRLTLKVSWWFVISKQLC